MQAGNPNSQKIVLKPVGSHHLHPQRLKKQLNNTAIKVPNRLRMHNCRTPNQGDNCINNDKMRQFYDEQEIELVENNEPYQDRKLVSKNLTKQIKQKLLQQENVKFNLIQDPRQSQFSYRKYIMMEKILLVLTVFYIFLCIFRTQVMDSCQDLSQQSNYKNQEIKLIVIMHIITFTIVFCVFMRGVCLNQLQIDQKKMYCVRFQKGVFADIARFLKNSQSRAFLFIQLAIILIHPNLLSRDLKIKLPQQYSSTILTHDVNDILCLSSLWRIYIVFRSLINITQYAAPRAVRLCNYNRINHDIIYSIKCLLQERSLLSIFMVFYIAIIVLGYSLRITEGTIHRQNVNIPQNGFEDYINCFWCIFITMATVGYGDYYPKTILGRFVCFLGAISGIIVCSLLIVSLSAYLKMQPSQTSSHLTLIRLQHQKKLQEQATQALIETMKLSNHLSSEKKKNDGEQVKKIFTKLKQKIDIVKYRSRKIKSMVNNNNIMEQMNRLFELLRQSLIELFRNQVKLKEELLELNQNKNKKIDKKKLQTYLILQNMNNM